jgi:hypothetical protein
MSSSDARTPSPRSRMSLGDEPDWTGLISVVPLELDEREMSAN